MLNAQGDLYAVELAFFSLSLLFCIFLIFKYGLRRQSVWLFLAILAILRIIGGSIVIYAQINHDSSPSLLATAAITSAIGTAPLLFSWLDCQRTLATNVESTPIHSIWFRAIQISGTVAVALSVVGGIREANGDSSGKVFLEVGAIIFLAEFVGLLPTFVFMAMGNHKLDTALFRVCAAVIPFVAVRIAFTMGVGLSSPGGVFYFEGPSIWVTAFMQFLPEAIFTIILVAYGVVASGPGTTNQPVQHSRHGVSVGNSLYTEQREIR